MLVFAIGGYESLVVLKAVSIQAVRVKVIIRGEGIEK
jgi:hypothetical protein